MLSLSKLHSDVINIVDIGAMDVLDDKDPFVPLQNKNTVSFEPNKVECDKLRDRGINALPYYIGDGDKHVFYEGAHPMTSSFYEPNMTFLDLFSDLSVFHEVVSRSMQQTVRLDDIAEIEDVDLLKIDAQGSEVNIINNGHETLKHTMVVHTEVCFVPLYKKMPLFGDVDKALRDAGFMFLRFFGHDLCGRCYKPARHIKDRFKPVSQIMWADAVYIKDVLGLDGLRVDKLLKFAIIMNDVYHAFDLVYHILEIYDNKVGSVCAESYKQLLKGITSDNGRY